MVGFRSPGSLNRKSADRPSGPGALIDPAKNQPLDAQGAKPLAPHEQASLDQMEAGLKGPSTPSKGAQRYQDNVASRQNPPVQRASTPKLFGNKTDDAPAPAAEKQKGTGGFSLPKYPGGLGGLVGAARGAGAFFKQRKKQTGIIGAILALVGVLIFGGGGLSVFKLIHIRQVLSGEFGKHLDHMANRRLGHIWVAVADKNGNVTYERNTGKPVRDHIYNIKSRKIVADLKQRGLNVSLDPANGKILIDGRPMGDVLKEEGGSDKLKERRAYIRNQLAVAYPEDSALRRSVRFQRVARIYGIKRTFFENSREKVDDWERETRKRMRERLFGANTGDTTIKAGLPDSPEGTASTALEELKKNVGADADKLKADALNNPDKLINNVNTDIDFNSAALAETGKGMIKGSVNMTAWLAGICEVRNFMNQVKIGAALYRERSLARYAGSIFVAADQLMEGKDITPGQFNALMLSLSAIEQSGAWQRITQANPSAKVPTASKYSLDMSNGTGGGATFAKISNKLDEIPNSTGACKVVTNIFFQIGATVVTIGLDVFTGGSVSFASVAASASAGTAVAVAESVLKPMAIQMVAGMTVTGDEPGKDRGDALVAGASIIMNNLARQNGGRPLTRQQVSEIDRSIAAEQIAVDQQKGIVWRLFDLNNPRSITARVAFHAPTTVGEAGQKISSYIARINPFFFFGDILQPNGLLSRISSTASADDLSDISRLFGVTTHGLTDAEIDRYPDPEALEQSVIGDESTKQQYIDFEQRCLIGEVINPEDQKMCSSEDEIYIRFRVYHLDKGLTGNLDYVSESTDELPNDDDDGTVNTNTGDTTDTTIVTGTAQELATQILHNSKISFNTGDAKNIMTLASQGKAVPVACKGSSTSLDPRLLQLMLGLANDFSYSVGYITNGCHSATSNHYFGRAIDVNQINGKEADGVTATDKAFMQKAADIMGSIKSGGELGQVGCIGKLNLPSGVHQVTDPCNHLHIAIED